MFPSWGPFALEKRTLVMYREIHSLRHCDPALFHVDLIIAVRQAGRDGDVKLIQSNEAPGKPRIGQRRAGRPKRDRDSIHERVALSNDDAGQNRRSYVAEADAVGHDHVTRLRRTAVQSE